MNFLCTDRYIIIQDLWTDYYNLVYVYIKLIIDPKNIEWC